MIGSTTYTAGGAAIPRHGQRRPRHGPGIPAAGFVGNGRRSFSGTPAGTRLARHRGQHPRRSALGRGRSYRLRATRRGRALFGATALATHSGTAYAFPAATTTHMDGRFRAASAELDPLIISYLKATNSGCRRPMRRARWAIFGATTSPRHMARSTAVGSTVRAIRRRTPARAGIPILYDCIFTASGYLRAADRVWAVVAARTSTTGSRPWLRRSLDLMRRSTIRTMRSPGLAARSAFRT